MTMSIAEVRRKLTKLKLENPDLVLPLPLCGKGITAKKLQEVYDTYGTESEDYVTTGHYEQASRIMSDT